MRKTIILVLYLISIFMLSACGIDVDESSKNIRYIGEYNHNYYFTEYNQKTKEISISYLKDKELLIVESLNSYNVIGLIGNQVILMLSDHEARTIAAYKLFNLDSQEYTSIDSTAVEGLYNICFYDNEVIVFHTLSSNPRGFLIFDISTEQLIGDISIAPSNFYSYMDIYYENSKLYIHLNYTSNDEENFDYIYDIDSEVITSVDSNQGNYMTVNSNSLLFLESNFRYETKGYWVDSESVALSYFLSANYKSIKMYEGFIIEDQFYDRQINILDEDFIVVDQIDLSFECAIGRVISENELICTQEKTIGSLIKSQKVKFIIYNFNTKEIIDESNWMDSGSQLGNI